MAGRVRGRHAPDPLARPCTTDTGLQPETPVSPHATLWLTSWKVWAWRREGCPCLPDPGLWHDACMAVAACEPSPRSLPCPLLLTPLTHRDIYERCRLCDSWSLTLCVDDALTFLKSLLVNVRLPLPGLANSHR